MIGKDLTGLSPYYYKTTSIDNPFDKITNNVDSSIFKYPFPVDITEEQDSINISAELPGVKKDDITVEFSNGVLTIKAEKTEENKANKTIFLKRERNYAMVKRSFNVVDVDSENITANYKDGILFITLKKVKDEFKEVPIS